MKKCFSLFLIAILLFSLFACDTGGTVPGGETPGGETPGGETPGGGEPTVPTKALSLAPLLYASVGDRLTVKATAENCDLSKLEFSLSDESYCSSFSSNGGSCTMRFKKTGEVTLTASCEGLEASCKVTVFPAESVYAPAESLITYLGRTAAENGTRVFRNTATGFEVTFFGKTLTADFAVDGTTAIAVFVDGEGDAEENKRLLEKHGSCVLAEFEQAGLHTVRVQKISEESISVLSLRSLTVKEGGLVEGEKVERIKIEVYGDSITCGYGNMRPDAANDGLFATTQNGLKTYAALAAARLDADYRVFARSGIGLYTNPHGLAYHMTDVYNRISPMSPASDKWDMQANAPDVVIINLGTNDAGANATNSPQAYNANDFKQACIAFVKTLYEAYGNEDIIFVLCTGMMVKNVTTPTAEAATILQSEGINAHALDLPVRSHSSGHPLYSQHLACADILFEKIAELLTQ